MVMPSQPQSHHQTCGHMIGHSPLLAECRHCVSLCGIHPRRSDPGRKRKFRWYSSHPFLPVFCNSSGMNRESRGSRTQQTPRCEPVTVSPYGIRYLRHDVSCSMGQK